MTAVAQNYETAMTETEQGDMMEVCEERQSLLVEQQQCVSIYFYSHSSFLCIFQIAVAYQTLDALQEHGIAAGDIAKLQAAGYHTVESIAHATVRKLTEVKGISEAKVMKLKELTKSMVPMDFKTAADALEDRKCVSNCFYYGKRRAGLPAVLLIWFFLFFNVLFPLSKQVVSDTHHGIGRVR